MISHCLVSSVIHFISFAVVRLSSTASSDSKSALSVHVSLWSFICARLSLLSLIGFFVSIFLRSHCATLPLRIFYDSSSSYSTLPHSLRFSFSSCSVRAVYFLSKIRFSCDCIESLFFALLLKLHFVMYRSVKHFGASSSCMHFATKWQEGKKSKPMENHQNKMHFSPNTTFFVFLAIIWHGFSFDSTDFDSRMYRNGWRSARRFSINCSPDL